MVVWKHSLFVSAFTVLTATSARADFVDCPAPDVGVAPTSPAKLTDDEQTRHATSSGTAGLSDSMDPTWTVIAGSNVTSLDVSKPDVAFGLERANPWTLARVTLNKNLAESTVTGDVRSRDFGQAVLTPALAAFGVSARGEYRPLAYVMGCKANGKYRIHTKKSFGFYGSFEAASLAISATRPDASVIRGSVVPIAVSVGATARLEGRMPDSVKLGSAQLMLSPYLGFAMRAISEDLGNDQREEVFGTDQRFLYGAEIGVVLQVSNFVFDTRLTLLTNDDKRLIGASGAQVQVRLSFLLPWSVLGGDTTPSTKQTVQ